MKTQTGLKKLLLCVAAIGLTARVHADAPPTPGHAPGAIVGVVRNSEKVPVSGATVTAVSSTMSWTMSCCCASVAGSRRWARDFLRSGRCGLGVEAPVMLTGRLIASSQRKSPKAEAEFGGLTFEHTLVAGIYASRFAAPAGLCRHTVTPLSAWSLSKTAQP